MAGKRNSIVLMKEAAVRFFPAGLDEDEQGSFGYLNRTRCGDLHSWLPDTSTERRQGERKNII